jgi:hypothetical protein
LYNYHTILSSSVPSYRLISQNLGHYGYGYENDLIHEILRFLQVKDKEKREEKPPFIDYSCLRSKTVQILLLSSAFTAFGMYNPLFSLVSSVYVYV